MQINNNVSPSFKGKLFISSSTLKSLNGTLKEPCPTFCKTTPQQDTLIKKAVNYFLDGKESRVLDKDDSACFSELINGIIGKKIFMNKEPKKLEKTLYADEFIYSDVNISSKNAEYLAIVAKNE